MPWSLYLKDMRVFAFLMMVLLSSACSAPLWDRVPILRPGPEDARPEARVDEKAEVPPLDARTVDEFDTTSAEDRAEATSGQGGTLLGTTIASLGAVTEPGFWLKTPLVSTPAPGRVELPKTGTFVNVDLIPLDGPETGGSQLSLGAMRLLDVPLTDLPELRVYQR